MENDRTCKVHDIGKITTIIALGYKLKLKIVKSIFNLGMNILSIEKFDDQGFSNHFYNGVWKHVKGYLVVVKGKINAYYVTKISVDKRLPPKLKKVRFNLSKHMMIIENKVFAPNIRHKGDCRKNISHLEFG